VAAQPRGVANRSRAADFAHALDLYSSHKKKDGRIVVFAQTACYYIDNTAATTQQLLK
jgi:hypothetical protein